MFPRNVAGRLALIALTVLMACKSDTTDPDPGSGSFALTVSAGQLSIVQGSSGTLTATVARSGNFTGAVAIAIEGLPDNVTASASPASIGTNATSSTLMFSAGSDAEAGTSTITIRATGSGVTEQSGTATLTITAAEQPDFTIALNPATISVQQNAQGASAANLTRSGGFDGSVSFSSSGAPTGVAVSFDPESTTSNTSSITVAVGASVPANTYAITITGSADGIDDRTATLNVTVTAATGGGGGNTTYRFCSGNVLFAAYQDGDGPWTAATVTNDAITFNLASGRGGVAFVSQSGNGYQTFYFFATQAELNTGLGQCPQPGPTKSVNASIANVGATELVYAGLGTGLGTTTGAVPNFMISGIRDGVTDLVATRVTMDNSTFVQTANKGIIRRGINPAANSTLPVLDFDASEAFDLTMRSITVNNLGSDALILSESFTTVAGGVTSLYSDALGGSGSTRQVPTIPDTESGDLHLVSLFAGEAPFALSRSVVAYFSESADKTFTLGPVLGDVTVTTAATSPNALLRAQYTLQPEYDDAITINYQQGNAATLRFVIIGFTGNYLGSASTLDHTQGDLTGLTGWDDTWGLSTGTMTTWALVGIDYGALLGQLDGAITTMATRNGTVTP